MDRNDLQTRIALVEQEIGATTAVLQRFDTAIEKLVDVSNSLKELLAVHDNRLIEREKADLTIFDMMEKRKEEYSRGVERIHQKIEDISTDMRTEIRSVMKEISDKLDKRIDNAVVERNAMLNDMKDTIKNQGQRIDSLEKWRWVVVGGGITLGFIIGKWGSIAPFFSG